jgi:hypothetical protein
VHREGERQQDRDPVGASQPREHPDDGPERDAEDGDREVVGLQRDLEAEEQILPAHRQ